MFLCDALHTNDNEKDSSNQSFYYVQQMWCIETVHFKANSDFLSLKKQWFHLKKQTKTKLE
jgi:hypothetical protein